MTANTPAALELLRDPRGLAVTAANARAVDALEGALEILLGTRGGIERHVDEALRCDPHWILAHCVRAAVRLLRTDDGLRWRDDISEALGTSDRSNDRERRHALALRAWLAGDRHAAHARYGELLDDYPRDVFALYVAHTLDFRFGTREVMRERIDRVLPHWHAGIPHYAYVLGMRAFSLVETGDYAGAEADARRSLQLVPDNAAAMHALAHVFEMQGRARDGIVFLESTRATWAANPGFAIHNAWHLALFHIDRGAADHALGIYDRVLRPLRSSPVAALVDASALLWRLELRGVHVGKRWCELAKCWRRKPLHGARAFNLLHAMMAFVGARRRHAAGGVLELLRRDPDASGANASSEPALALAFGEALQAFGRGDHGLAVEKIQQVRAQAERCGGSIAQCDLIHLTFLEAALRGRRARLARALAAERTVHKPQSLLNRWLFWRAGAVARLT